MQSMIDAEMEANRQLIDAVLEFAQPCREVATSRELKEQMQQVATGSTT